MSGRFPSGATPSSAIGPHTYFQAYAAAAALHFAEKALAEVHAGRTRTFTEFKVPDEAIGCGFHEAVRGVLSHHLVIRDKKIANYHPYPPTPWNGNPRDVYGTPGPYEDAVQGTPIFEENGPDKFKGIDIMRGSAQLRSLLAVRRAYVRTRRKAAPRNAPRSDLWRADALTRGGTMAQQELAECVERIDVLLNKIEALPDDALRQDVQEIVHCLLDYHGAAVARLSCLARESVNDPSVLSAHLAGDELASSLLVLHGLHPDDLESRVHKALENVRPFLKSHGGNVELANLTDDVVHLRLEGSCHGCPSSAATLKSRIEQAIYEVAPEVRAIEVVEDEKQPPPTNGFVGMERLSIG